MDMQTVGLDPLRLRALFPALDQVVHGKPLVYLDSAATSQKPVAVIEALDRYYRDDNANVHRGIHELSRRATEAFEDARRHVARWIGAKEAAEVVWTRGTTEAINLVASSWGPANVGEGDEIVLTVLEHHSNIVPWQLLARRTGAVLRYIELDDQGRLILDDLDTLLTERTRLVALSHVSNALGTINPVEEIVRKAHDVGALVLVDGAQGAVHLPIDVQALGADFYAFSGHKMCGPTGIGVLWARKELLDAMPPYQGGGEMIHIVERDSSTWAKYPTSSRRARPTSPEPSAWMRRCVSSKRWGWTRSRDTSDTSSSTRWSASVACRASGSSDPATLPSAPPSSPSRWETRILTTSPRSSTPKASRSARDTTARSS